MTGPEFSGIATPVLTPFNHDGSLAPDLYGAHCRWVLEQGSHYVSPFGTTGEALSTSMDERIRALESLVEKASVPPSRILPGTGLCSLPETLRLTRHALDMGCAAVLVLPPFFYVQATDAGLYRYFSELIDRVGSDRLRICLYHIPPQAGIGFSPQLVHRLNRAFPDTVVAIKDSSGEWDNTLALFESAPQVNVFPGSETFLLQGLQHGGAGCISATCNINAARIRQVYDLYQGEDPDALAREDGRMRAFRQVIQAAGPIPAMKALLAEFTGDSRWNNIRAPLMALGDTQIQSLVTRLGPELDHLRTAAGSG